MQMSGVDDGTFFFIIPPETTGDYHSVCFSLTIFHQSEDTRLEDVLILYVFSQADNNHILVCDMRADKGVNTAIEVTLPIGDVKRGNHCAGAFLRKHPLQLMAIVIFFF